MYACTHLANSASLLLPVSNLTNLLAFAAAGASLLRFGELMALPWLAAIAVEYLVFRRFFAADLAVPGQPEAGSSAADVPLFPVLAVAATLAGFVVTSLAGVSPAWAAFGGACVLAVRALARRGITPGGLVRLGGRWIPAVRARAGAGRDRRAARAGPRGPACRRAARRWSCCSRSPASPPCGQPGQQAARGARPPPVLGAGLPGRVLAVLIGVNIGPNLTYAGSLATMPWRRILRERDHEPDLGEFTRLGLLTVPAGLAAATTALWAALRLVSG